MDEKSEALDRMEKVIAEYKDKIEVKAAKAKEAAITKKEAPITKTDMEDLLNKMINKSTAPADPAVTKPAVKQEIIVNPAMDKEPEVEHSQIAYQIWKDQRALSIICFIAVLLPICTIFITMIAGEMFALVAAFIGMIYPLITFMKSMMVQARLYVKYGYKPLLQFRRPMPPNMMNKSQQPKENMGDTIL